MEKLLISVLAELSSASKLIHDEASLQKTKHKYNMIFAGEKNNMIFSSELHHTLAELFNTEIGFQELNALIPKACLDLNMKCSPMIDLDGTSNQAPCQYRIELW